MKVVLFCGGLGTRIREYSESIPKPMIPVGNQPILWHVMKYYAHYGHSEFILCLGYKADLIKEYFINYNEYLSNDFTLSNGGKNITLENSDIRDWKITFVDTGLRANIGQRAHPLIFSRRDAGIPPGPAAAQQDSLTLLDPEFMDCVVNTFHLPPLACWFT